MIPIKYSLSILWVLVSHRVHSRLANLLVEAGKQQTDSRCIFPRAESLISEIACQLLFYWTTLNILVQM